MTTFDVERDTSPCAVVMRGLTRVSITLHEIILAKQDGLPGPGSANRLRPTADFGGQEASPGFPVLVRRSFSEGGQARQ
jgi:hypothetical protein